MVSFRTSFVLLATAFVNVAFASLDVQRRDLSTIEADFGVLSADLAAITTDLNNLASGGQAGFKALGADYNKILADVQSTTVDVQATAQLDETDSQNFFQQDVTPAAETLISVLNLIASQKQTFENFATSFPGLFGTIVQGLQQFEQSTDALMTALHAIAQPDVVQQGAPIDAALGNAFASVIATYSSD